MYLKKVCYDVQERNEGEIHWDGAWVTVCCLLLPGRTAVTILYIEEDCRNEAGNAGTVCRSFWKS